MEILAIVAVLVALIVLYFCLGIALRFLWGWWILCIAVPICVVIGFAFGWVGAICAIGGFCLSLYVNNEWHSTSVFLAVAGKIDRLFNFNDT